MKLSPLIAPVLGLGVTTAASIAFESGAKLVIPSDLKAVPAFGVKIGVAIVGGILAGKIAQIVVDNVQSVVDTVANMKESEEVYSEEVQEEN